MSSMSQHALRLQECIEATIVSAGDAGATLDDCVKAAGQLAYPRHDAEMMVGMLEMNSILSEDSEGHLHRGPLWTAD